MTNPAIARLKKWHAARLSRSASKEPRLPPSSNVRVAPVVPAPRRRSDRREIRFHLNGHIGDAVVGVYVACGLADAGYMAVLSCRRAAWLVGCVHPGVAVIYSRDNAEGDPDANSDYRGQCVAGSRREGSRVKWYCDRIAAAAAIPRFSPSRPETVIVPRPVLGTGYVLLCPLSSNSAREWPITRWRELAARLLVDGWRVCSTGDENEAKRLEKLFDGMPVESYAGNPTAWALSAVANATLVVSNDSGMAHLAGLYAVPALAVMSHLTADFVFGEVAPTVRGVHPDASDWACSPCGWQHDRGYSKWRCERCPALASIDARVVPLPVLAKHELNTGLGIRSSSLIGPGE